MPYYVCAKIHKRTNYFSVFRLFQWSFTRARVTGQKISTAKRRSFLKESVDIRYLSIKLRIITVNIQILDAQTPETSELT